MTTIIFGAVFVFIACGYLILHEQARKKKEEKEARKSALTRCCELEIDCEFCSNNCFKN